MVYFQTERLIFRDWNKPDIIDFIKMNEDSEVMKYFPSKLTSEESVDFLSRIKEEFTRSGYGLYPVELKETGEFIGYIGFHLSTFKSDFTPCVEIGWRLKREYWGRGYATEGALACLEYGFNHLGFEEVYSFTATINIPSENLMRRLGMHYMKNFMHPKVDDEKLMEHVLYYMNNEQYNQLK